MIVCSPVAPLRSSLHLSPRQHTATQNLLKLSAQNRPIHVSTSHRSTSSTPQHSIMSEQHASPLYPACCTDSIVLAVLLLVAPVALLQATPHRITHIPTLIDMLVLHLSRTLVTPILSYNLLWYRFFLRSVALHILFPSLYVPNTPHLLVALRPFYVGLNKCACISHL